MCWSGIDRTIAIYNKGYCQSIDINSLLKARESAHKSIENAVVKGSLRNGPEDESFDASLLLLPMVRFPDSTVCHKTVMDIYQSLHIHDEKGKSGFLYRYLRPDDFGTPRSSFLICSFWLAMALMKVKEHALAHEVMQKVIRSSNHVGLFSEHYIPHTQTQLGNFPQAYSHVGLINAAFAVSPAWDLFI